MAIYTKPIGEPRILGSREGATFQRAANGFLIRKRAVPVQKRTARQSESKQLLATTSQHWRTLSAAEQDTWNTEQENYPRNNSLGDEYFLTGPQLQTSSNINLQNTEQSTIDSIPAFETPEPIAFDDLFINLTTDLLQFSTDPFNVPADRSYKYFFSPIYQPGVTSANTADYFFIAILQAGESTLSNLYAAYIAKFTEINIAVGNIFYGRVETYNNNTGQREQSLTAQGFIQS